MLAKSADPKLLNCVWDFQIPSPFETKCCQKLANYFAALRQLYLTIKNGPEHKQRIWDTLRSSKSVLAMSKFSSHFICLKGTNSFFVPVPPGIVSPEKN